MFCPRCSQEQISGDTRFCSRCGFLMTGVSQLLADNGMLPQLMNPADAESESPRQKGIKRGGKMMLLGLILVPLITILSVALNLEPTLTILTAILTFWGGLLRIIYAAIFESKNTSGKNIEENILNVIQKIPINSGTNGGRKSLNSRENIPDFDYILPARESWRNTNDLVQRSVTEETTGLLREE